MTTPIKLTDTQTNVLGNATDRPDGNIEPLPPSIKGGARIKVIEGLLTRGLIVRHDEATGSSYHLTDAGYAVLGRTRQVPDAVVEAVEEHPQPDLSAENQGVVEASADADAKSKPHTRQNSKQAQVLAMLQRPEGATVAQIMAATGWQAHTVRGTFAGAFKKKLGLTITSVKSEAGERIYRL